MIQYYRKITYGQERIYLADDTTKHWTSILTGKETVSHADLKALWELTGLEPVEVLDPNRSTLTLELKQ